MFLVLGFEPSWTTWKTRSGSHGEKKRCIDYIWMTKGILAMEILNIPKVRKYMLILNPF